MINKGRLLRNILSNYVIIFIRLIVGLVSVPIFIGKYGAAQYGIFLLIVELPQILTNFDIGASKSLIRYCADFREDRSNKSYSSKAISSGITLSLLFAGVATVLMLIGGFFISSIYKVDEQFELILKWLFYSCAFSSFFTFVGQIPQSILFGFGYFAQRNLLQVFTLVYQILLIALVYYLDLGLLDYALLYFLSPIITLCFDLFLILKNKLLEGLNIALIPLKSVFKSEFIRYNFDVFSLSMIAIFSSMMDKQIVGIILGVEAVTVYVIVTKPFFVAKSLFANINNVLRSEISGFKTNAEMANSSFVYTFIYLFVSLFSFLSFMAWAYWPYMSVLWLGSDKYAGYSPFVGLSIFNLGLAACASTFINYFLMKGITKSLIRIELLTVSANLTLSIILINLVGVQGAIVGTTLQMLLNAVIILVLSANMKIFKWDTFIQTVNWYYMTALYGCGVVSIFAVRLEIKLIIFTLMAFLLIYAFKGLLFKNRPVNIIKLR